MLLMGGVMLFDILTGIISSLIAAAIWHHRRKLLKVTGYTISTLVSWFLITILWYIEEV